MNKPYFLLTGVNREHGGAPELMFSDYDKEAVEYEKDAESLHYRYMKITKIANSEQSTVNAALVKLKVFEAV